MDDDDKKEKETPETPPTPPADPPTPPAVVDPPADTDGLRDEVTELKGIVTSLVETVAALAPLPGDQTPTAKPWTHRTFG